MIKMIALFVCTWGMLAAQTGIGGSASIALVDAGVNCAGHGRTVEVWVDLTGLSGLGGNAALGAFVLELGKSRSDIFASMDQGDLGNGWSFDYADSGHGIATVRWVGYSSEMEVPSGNILIARITLTGVEGNLTLTLNSGPSSLASTIVNGDGPGPIGIQTAPVQLTVNIPITLNLTLQEGASWWRQLNSSYNLEPSSNLIDIRDLVELMDCGG